MSLRKNTGRRSSRVGQKEVGAGHERQGFVWNWYLVRIISCTPSMEWKGPRIRGFCLPDSFMYLGRTTCDFINLIFCIFFFACTYDTEVFHIMCVRGKKKVLTAAASKVVPNTKCGRLANKRFILSLLTVRDRILRALQSVVGLLVTKMGLCALFAD